MAHTKLLYLHSGTDFPNQLNNPVYIAHAVLILPADFADDECNGDFATAHRTNDVKWMRMKLIQIIGELPSCDTADTESTIYASEPWTTESEAIVARESEMSPSVLERLKMKYFLEVLVARDFLNDWIASLEKAPTVEERCARLIHYAINDA